jgi:hypothetical protein
MHYMQRSTEYPPIRMEALFRSAYKDGPAVHVGSRTLSLFADSPYEQAYETVHLAYTKPDDVIVLRQIDQTYLDYWKQLIGDVIVYDLSVWKEHDPGAFLSTILLESPNLLRAIKNQVKTKMADNTHLFVFFPTVLEQRLADKLEIPLYGDPRTCELYGTKSGVQQLASQAHVPMPQRRICATTTQILAAIGEMFAQPSCVEIIVKHDHSIGGGWSLRITKKQYKRRGQHAILNEVLTALHFQEGQESVVVEEWLAGARASVATHIEIHPAFEEPIIRWGWHQLLETDGVSYRGAIPLQFSPATVQAVIAQSQGIARALQWAGGSGSYAPNFLMTEDDQPLLLELNARVPFSAFGLSIVQKLKGEIGEGFMTQYVSVPSDTHFQDVYEVLKRNHLLIEAAEGSATRGVVPFNIGLLPYGKCSLVAMAPTWEEARTYMYRAVRLLSGQEERLLLAPDATIPQRWHHTY